ncbi:protein SCO1 homolog, mitochondrial-like [Actinia tenebrosa]|uniref:Protein SCO1 homolog, mitochondrial-like n=1 Tax=Actinia tenebrosa TaxID=6105 RepID=A0A6P8HL88_ACTTE|nr:protein SCO1 homolog, mitochondrial-like [Actinia tenebrosa]
MKILGYRNLQAIIHTCLRSNILYVQSLKVPSRFISRACFPRSSLNPRTSRSILQRAESGPHKDQAFVRSSKRGPISWTSFVLFALAGGGVVYYVKYLKEEKEKEKEKEKQKSIGKVALGGPFDLIDNTGKPVTDKDFRGKWLLIYFGFTHCPDICPDELEKMAQAIDASDKATKGKVKEELQPLFITVDPRRDDPKAITEYLKEFHPKLIGLTGPVEKVKEVCKSYRVYFSAGPADDDDDYIVDHTIIQYLVNPDGEFMEYFGQNKDASQIAASIINHMLKYSLSK